MGRVKRGEAALRLMKMEDARHTVFVQTPAGPCHTLEVSGSDKVLSVKAMIQDVDGVPSEQQRLDFAGKSLQDEKTLEQSCVGKDCTIRLQLRLLGGAPKKKKKGGDGDNPGELTEKEQADIAKMRVEFLERELMLKKEEAVEAIHAKNGLRERVKEYHDEFEREKMRTLDITADMTRQYKAMHELFIMEINQLENQILGLHDQLKLSEMKLERNKADAKTQLDEKEKTINEQHNKMEQMAAEFGSMLEETLKKMTSRIKMSSESYDDDEGAAEDEDGEPAGDEM